MIHFYNPCNRLTKEILEDIGKSNNNKVIWCGDFNAHNTL